MLLIVSAALRTAAAHAEPTDADRTTARALVIIGRKRLAAGDAGEALKAFQEAHSIMGVPTTGLDLAKAQESVGMLIEAHATALAVTRMPVAPDEPRAFTNARPAAAQLAVRIEQQIPTMLVEVKGIPISSAPSLRIDGAAIQPRAVGARHRLNPGKHVVVVSAPGFMRHRREVTLYPGESRVMKVILIATERGTQARSADEPQPSLASAGASPGIPAWAWVAGASGVLVLCTGAAFAVDYAKVSSRMARHCPDDVCDPTRYTAADVNDLKSRERRDLGLAASLGVVGLSALGITLYGIVTAPSTRPGHAREPTAATPSLRAGLLGGSLGWRF
ncbi:hypothetical protein [Sorangium sp. So ce388]|uniref:hypothetical protein n=1 Tax=Sorangium sp. So ce388 TaxID=3133309 RepID=UPI003F5C0F2E